MTNQLAITETQIEPMQYGAFWIVEGKQIKKWSISRVDLVKVASKIGFCLFRGSLYRIIGKFIHECDERSFQDAMLNYIEDEGQVDYIGIVNALEAFMQKNGKYTISRLPIISDDAFLRDDRDTCYKFFKNGVVKITAEGIKLLDYSQLPEDKYILFTKIKQRDFALNETGKYIQFLQLATAWTEHEQNIKSIIGYLAHEYKDETTGYIVVLTEQCPDPKDGGGSGKNLFCNLLSNTTTYTSKNGKQVNYDEKFFQSWTGQRIMGISDVPKNFDFEFLKEPSTGTFILKKLFENEVEIPVQDGPKFIVQTNYSYEISDGGLKRRIMPIEFTDFFTKAGGVDVYFGCHFPQGWTETDWNNFDTIIIASIETWLKSNRKIQSAELTETGWEKQFEHTHGLNLTTFIRENFDAWVQSIEIASKTLQGQLNTFYIENSIDKKYQYSSQRVASAIKEWSVRHFVSCQTNVVKRNELNITEKRYVFEATKNYVKKEPEF